MWLLKLEWRDNIERASRNSIIHVRAMTIFRLVYMVAMKYLSVLVGPRCVRSNYDLNFTLNLVFNERCLESKNARKLTLFITMINTAYIKMQSDHRKLYFGWSHSASVSFESIFCFPSNSSLVGKTLIIIRPCDQVCISSRTQRTRSTSLKTWLVQHFSFLNANP